MLSAMVLAAGLGTRLRPLTDAIAKALAPVGDRPMLAHILERLRAAGVDRTAVNAHYKADQVRAFLRCEPGSSLSYEPELLGTAGGVAQAGPMLGDGDVLVYNADILADIDLAALVAAHGSGSPEATLVVRLRAAGSGNVGLDDTGRIVRLRDQRSAPEALGADFLGVHVLGDRLRRSLPRSGCLVGDVYIPALLRGATLRGWAHASPTYDIGTLEGYLEANLAWLAPSGAAFWCGPGAEAAPTVTLDRVVLGEEAKAIGDGRLERSVVWPGAVAAAPLSDAIVTAREAVRVRPEGQHAG
jgi:mannose-1-phosphate guanylyltransferase